MRRFFTVLFVLSLIATAATLYWRTYLPEETVVSAAPPSASNDRSLRPGGEGAGGGSGDVTSFSREEVRQPSERQDYAVTISILSSIISAVAAIFQTWLTARAYRR
ncbi:MAG: hypothetical protein HC850_15585 [Rhodomicrobium sp.]|nr:hypothetical protein [Rhodomicrobium sp.]